MRYVVALLVLLAIPHGAARAQALESLEREIVGLFERAAPSVVSISMRRDTPAARNSERPRGGDGAGSGFVWDTAGHIVTNAHVLDGLADGRVLSVSFDGTRRLPASVVGMAPEHDLAVIRLDTTDRALQPIARGTSEGLRVGQLVFAIGNPFGLDRSLSQGLISALGRRLPTVAGREVAGVIQTDAAINPGNSGGPLVDSSGAVVGVNTAIIVDSQNVGFSIPINTVKALLPQLEQGNGGEIEVRRTFLGVSTAAVSELDPQALAELGITGDNGAVITRVEPGSAADSAGLVAGDVIISIDGEAVSTPSELRQRIRAHEPGDEVDLEVQRSGTTETLAAILGES